MSTAISISDAAKNAAQKYNRDVERFTVAYLTELVGPERVREAVARFKLSFRVAAAAAPQLREAPVEAVAQAIALCALTDLQPGGPLPDCYLIPRKSKNPATGRWDVPGVQWMISYRGLRKLAERSGFALDVVPVFEGEEFGISRGLTPTLTHVPDYLGAVDRSWDRLLLVYVISTPRRGAGDRPRFEIITKAEIEKRRDSSDAWQRFKAGRASSSVWADWPIEMALKTAARYAISRGLVPLDDVGKVAYQADGVQDADVVEAGPVIVEPMQIAAAPARGMDGLRQRLEEIEPVRTPATVTTVTTVEGRPTKEETRQRVGELAASCRAMEAQLGGDGVNRARDSIGMQRTSSLGRMGVATLEGYLDALSVWLDILEPKPAAEPVADDLPFGDVDA